MQHVKLTPDSKIFVAGHTGLIGSAFLRRLDREGFRNIITRTRQELDLTDGSQVEAFFQLVKPEIVVLAAGRVGGIVDNKTYPFDYVKENLAIELNVIRNAHEYGVHKLVFFGSSCMYPRECSQPMSEDKILSGKLEPTSISYAIAKLAGMQMCLSHNQQHGQKSFLPVIPNSAYGSNDNFDPSSSHVLSALLHRFHEACKNGVDSVELWGSGKPFREFVYVEDIVDACIFLLCTNLDGVEFPLNIGTGEEHSIRHLAKTIADVTGYKGRIKWDTTKPDGTPRKLLDSSYIQSLGWQPKTSLLDGIRATYKWYLEHLASETQRTKL